jgi:hypothetical protein
MTSASYTFTFTASDIRKVFDQFAADYDMAAQSTGLLTASHVDSVIHDVKVMAEKECIDCVDIVLLDSRGKTIRAQKYQVSTDASLWAAQRPGNSMWPRTPDGTLKVIVNPTSRKWKELGAELKMPWSSTDIDTAYPHLSGNVDRHYSSNAYGLKRTTYTQ